MLLSWWHRLVHMANSRQARSKGVHHRRIPRKVRFAARLEQLEDRLVPTTPGVANAFPSAGHSLTNIAAVSFAFVPQLVDTGTSGATGTTTTVTTSNASPVYGNAVTLTATVAPAAGTTVTPQGSVAFFINGITLLGAGTFAGSDANNDALFTYVTGRGQLQVNGAPQPVVAVFTGGTGFSSSTSTNSVGETVAPEPLTVIGTAALNKVYDGATNATLNTIASELQGVQPGDTVNLITDAATGTFAGKDVGNGIAIAVAGMTLSGPQAGDYTLTQPTTSANITPAPLTVTGIKASDKVYDSTKSVTLNASGATLAGVLPGDTVTLSTAGATGSFVSKDVGTGVAVTVSGLSIGGPQAADYTLTPAATSANITPAPVTVTGVTAQDKVYDGTTAATLNTAGAALVGVFPGDTVTLNAAGAIGTFATKAVGNNIPVQVSGLTLSGPQAMDYTVTQPVTTGNITPDLLLNQLTVAEGTPTPLTLHLIQADHVSPPDTVVFTVVTAPAGTLMDGASKLTVGSTFTQAEINAGKVTFTGAAIGFDSLQFNATDGQGGTVPTSTLHFTIVKNFTEPPVTVADLSLLEGLSGLTPFNFVVKLPIGTSAASGPITYDVYTTDGTAKGNVDYMAIYPGITAPNSSGTVTFPQGASSAIVTVYVNAGAFSPTKATPRKTFSVSISNPNNFNSALATATGTIIGQAPKSRSLPTPTISNSSAVVGSSGLTAITFQVNLSVASAQDVTYDVFTTDGSALAFTNYLSVTAGVNNPNSIGTLTIKKGATHAVLTVYAIGGSLTAAGGNKDFTISLSDPIHPGSPLASAMGVLMPAQ
jgi:hypothetical protein